MGKNFKSGRGLDVGTSFIIAAREYEEGGKIMYSKFRDAFIRLKPSSPIAKKMIEKGLKGQQYFEDIDGSYVVVGQDAIERSIERNLNAERPLVRGVISPKQKQARRILRHIFKEILGEPLIENEKAVYSIPAQPIDQNDEEFDVGYHQDVLNNDIKGLGFSPLALSEAEAVCYSELEDDNYSGVAMSWGAGQVNVCLMSSGESILTYSTTKSGDFVDRMAAQATATPDTVVQVEKEGGNFRIGEEVPGNPILSAVSLYYKRLIDYTIQHLLFQFKNAKNLPKFTDSIPIVIAGGTSQANGFLDMFNEILQLKNVGNDELPFKIKEVRLAKDQLLAVSRGCLIAANL